MTTIFSPEDLGVPTRRRRRYTIFARTGVVELMHENIFKQVFHARCVLDASVYLVAHEDEIEEDK
eukprot:6104683-Alexandrium_andersonii.AAC.1